MNAVEQTYALIRSKVREWIIAWKYENLFSKEEILTMYLNKFEFVNGAHGIDAAAQTYFGKPQSELTLNEAATLVGMLKNPSLYNPVRFPDLVVKRRNEVLDKLNHPDAESFKNMEADFSKFSRITTKDTIVPYFKNALEKYLANLIRENNLKKPDGSYYNIYDDALTIESTIDLDLQKYAEAATREHMEWIQGWFDKDWSKKDPWTYGASQDELKIRQAALEDKAKASPRYQYMKKRILDPVLTGTYRNLTEADLKLAIDSEKDEVLLLSQPRDIRSKIKKLRASSEYSRIRKAYQQLQQTFKEVFNRPVTMQIFDIKSGNKEVVMSPMDSVRYHAELLQTGLVAIDPHTGEVKCWNGGLDFNYFHFDHVLSRRSIGSTAKPFLYTIAMEQKGIKPCQEFKDTLYTIMPGEGDFKNKEPWQPTNATNLNTLLMYNLYHGLLYSKNTITVRLLKEIGSVKPLIDMWDKMGIPKDERLTGGRLAVPDLPSIALGAVDITLLQLTSAYTTFANEGKYAKPILVKSIKDKAGKVIYQATTQANQVIQPLYNAIMLDMLQNNETGAFSMHLKSPNGGKTGTTDDQCDGWYIGLTPNLVVGIWTGGDEKWIRFLRDDVGQGYFTARPVFEKMIKMLENDTIGIYDVRSSFATPPDGFKELTDCSKKKTEKIPEIAHRSQLPGDGH